MKAAIVESAGQTPVYGEFREPVPAGTERRIIVSAAAVSHLVKNRASGAHYSSPGTLPFVVGVDGVGRLDDGRRVYFAFPQAPYGSMAEIASVPAERCIALPDEVDDVTAAAIANPGMSGWAALVERARLKPGETVLVNGATGSSGRLAVQIAKYLGAKKVIATGRNPRILGALGAIGADEVIRFSDDYDALEKRFKEVFAAGVDIVVDYLWGESTKRLLIACAGTVPEAVPLRYVQVGSIAGAEIALPAGVLRACAIQMMGSGIGSLSTARLVYCVGELLKATVPGRFDIAAKPVPLEDVETAWPLDDSLRRTVFTIG